MDIDASVCLAMAVFKTGRIGLGESVAEFLRGGAVPQDYTTALCGREERNYKAAHSVYRCSSHPLRERKTRDGAMAVG
jgi:hypothetical protein